MELAMLSWRTPWLMCLGDQHSSEYIEARVGISIKICCFFGMDVKRFYAVFLDRLSIIHAELVPLALPRLIVAFSSSNVCLFA
jgi:hypothetical protein